MRNVRSVSKVVVLALWGCRGAEPGAAERAAATPAADPDRPVILCVGTSLTAGYGLDPEQAYPALLQRRVDAEGRGYSVVNAGVSGETSAGALRRVDWLMRRPVAVFVLETGANDGLRGQDPESTRDNIRAILERVRQQQPPPRVLLAGMRTLTNYGPEYARRFRSIYPELARQNGVALLPFLLEGVAGNPTLNLPDGIHPNAEGQARIAEVVWGALRPLL